MTDVTAAWTAPPQGAEHGGYADLCRLAGPVLWTIDGVSGNR